MSAPKPRGRPPKHPRADPAVPEAKRRKSSIGGAPAVQREEGAYNLEITALRAVVLKSINDCPVFTDLVNENPLSITANGDTELCGREEPFNLVKFNASINAHGEYRAGCNLMWLAHTDQTKIPRNLTQIKKLRDHHFASPGPFPLDIVVAIRNGEDPMAMKGRLTRVSPSEIVDACFLAIERDIGIGDDSVLRKWRTCLLSAPFLFKVVESEEDCYVVVGNSSAKTIVVSFICYVHFIIIIIIISIIIYYILLFVV